VVNINKDIFFHLGAKPGGNLADKIVVGETVVNKKIGSKWKNFQFCPGGWLIDNAALRVLHNRMVAASAKQE